MPKEKEVKIGPQFKKMGYEDAKEAKKYLLMTLAIGGTIAIIGLLALYGVF